eukprot:TRINITY_DN35060_c0_g1_i1.p1 TRINITY_DN35060_c0_g1~~TRINITY_DN35060_c0_g1_i1.p1  ORF type:complete len:104 (+),score=4.33 TRINITY_DN35060_c0_g1_i1:368-679(+)
MTAKRPCLLSIDTLYKSIPCHRSAVKVKDSFIKATVHKLTAVVITDVPVAADAVSSAALSPTVAMEPKMRVIWTRIPDWLDKSPSPTDSNKNSSTERNEVTLK